MSHTKRTFPVARFKGAAKKSNYKSQKRPIPEKVYLGVSFLRKKPHDLKKQNGGIGFVCSNLVKFSDFPGAEKLEWQKELLSRGSTEKERNIALLISDYGFIHFGEALTESDEWSRMIAQDNMIFLSYKDPETEELFCVRITKPDKKKIFHWNFSNCDGEEIPEEQEIILVKKLEILSKLIIVGMVF